MLLIFWTYLEARQPAERGWSSDSACTMNLVVLSGTPTMTGMQIKNEFKEDTTQTVFIDSNQIRKTYWINSDYNIESKSIHPISKGVLDKNIFVPFL